MTVVLLSGGQDSGTCLYQEIADDREESGDGRGVTALHLHYGQRHAVEAACARWLADDAGVPIEGLDLGGFIERLAPSALLERHGGELRDTAGDENPYAAERGLPSSFVPGRNVFLLSAAAVWGAVRGHTRIVTGVCATDRAGYPDCRAEFVALLEPTLREALDLPELRIHAPLLRRTKAETWAMAEALGVVEEIIEHTHTCYAGEHGTRHPWGYGCGDCPACVTRRAGFEEFRAVSAPRTVPERP